MPKEEGVWSGLNIDNGAPGFELVLKKDRINFIESQRLMGVILKGIILAGGSGTRLLSSDNRYI